MSFTMFSAVLLLAVGLGVFIEAFRGVRRGLSKSLLALACVLLAALGATALAVWLSDYPTPAVSNIILRLLPMSGSVRELFPHLEIIVEGAVDALLSSLLFVVFFVLLRLILRLIVSILNRTCRRPLTHDVGYEGTRSPWYQRHDRLLGGVAGGFCGFAVSLMLLSPVIGTLHAGGTVLNALESMNIRLSSLGLGAGTVETVESFTEDPAVTLLYAAGGGIIYDATATTRIDDQPVSVGREVKHLCAFLEDTGSVISVLTKPQDMTPAQRRILGGLGKQIEGSGIARLLAADFLSNAAGIWLQGGRFMKISRPACGELIDPLMDGALQACAETTPECVGRDVTTVLNIYLIAVENGLLENPDYSQLANDLDSDGVLGQIYDELKKNPCMAHLADELTYIALRVMASAIEWQNFSDEIYGGLMGDLADAMNMVNGLDTDFADRVESMTEYTMQYAEQYGMELPESLAEMAATAIVQQMGGMEDVTASDFEAFLRYYLGGH
jgi:hypothetical protein